MTEEAVVATQSYFCHLGNNQLTKSKQNYLGNNQLTKKLAYAMAATFSVPGLESRRTLIPLGVLSKETVENLVKRSFF
jgi:hypothetical protein